MKCIMSYQIGRPIEYCIYPKEFDQAWQVLDIQIHSQLDRKMTLPGFRKNLILRMIKFMQ